jgi:hypothetical protein
MRERLMRERLMRERLMRESPQASRNEYGRAFIHSGS